VVECADEDLAARAEHVAGAVVVDPDLADQGGDDDEVEHAGEGVGIAGDVVDVGG
jgi:hypothetical protein